MDILRITAIVLAAAFLVILPLYIRQENRLDFHRATALKLTLSGIFTVISLISMILQGFAAANILVFAAMCFAVAGDYYLQFIRINMNKFKKGVIFFALCQICLIAGFFFIAGFHWASAVVLAILLLAALALMLKQNWQLGEARGVLTVYTVLIACMCAKAVTLFLAVPQISVIGAVLTGIGGLLFFISDMILGIWNYKTGDMLHADLNWATYFPGQLLIVIGAGLW